MPTTWNFTQKSAGSSSEVDFLFSDGLDFLFSDSTDFVFVEGATSIVWSNQSKNTASWAFVNQS